MGQGVDGPGDSTGLGFDGLGLRRPWASTARSNSVSIGRCRPIGDRAPVWCGGPGPASTRMVSSRSRRRAPACSRERAFRSSARAPSGRFGGLRPDGGRPHGPRRRGGKKAPPESANARTRCPGATNHDGNPSHGSRQVKAALWTAAGGGRRNLAASHGGPAEPSSSAPAPSTHGSHLHDVILRRRQRRPRRMGPQSTAPVPAMSHLRIGEVRRAFRDGVRRANILRGPAPPGTSG